MPALWIQNARVIDPASRRDATGDLFLDQGRIVAQGDHASLYAGNALYQSLYDRQQGTT